MRIVLFRKLQVLRIPAGFLRHGVDHLPLGLALLLADVLARLLLGLMHAGGLVGFGLRLLGLALFGAACLGLLLVGILRLDAA
ncbi:hypothetical protein D3C81_1804960 [compost metagenome]